MIRIHQIRIRTLVWVPINFLTILFEVPWLLCGTCVLSSFCLLLNVTKKAVQYYTVTFWYGSGSVTFASDQWIRIWISLFLSLTFKTLTKTLFFFFKSLLIIFLRYLHFPEIKSHKEVTTQRESRVFLLFLLDDRSIQETLKHTDPTDPDPQHCFVLAPRYHALEPFLAKFHWKYKTQIWMKGFECAVHIRVQYNSW